MITLQILYTDTCFTAQALVRIMVDLNEATTDRIHDKDEPRFCDVVAVFKLLTSQLSEARELLEVIYEKMGWRRVQKQRVETDFTFFLFSSFRSGQCINATRTVTIVSWSAWRTWFIFWWRWLEPRSRRPRLISSFAS